MNHQFELHTKMAEEIDLEKCNFCNFRSPMTLTWTLNWVQVTLVRMSGQGLPIHQIRLKLEKLFADVRTDVWMDTSEFSKSIRSSPGDDLKIKTASGKMHFCNKYTDEQHAVIVMKQKLKNDEQHTLTTSNIQLKHCWMFGNSRVSTYGHWGPHQQFGLLEAQ